MTATAERVKHHAEDEDLAYRLQIMGAREGAIKGTLVAGTLVALCNWRSVDDSDSLGGTSNIQHRHRLEQSTHLGPILARFPWMQRQTLAGKAFLTMWGTIFGMVTHADYYLLKWEAEHRRKAEEWRTRARIELAAQGSVPSETTMRAWKKKDDERKADEWARKQQAQKQTTATPTTTTTDAPVVESKVLQELQNRKEA
ncbi:BZ3500_MvSof-1268-A1-R1_Chr2-1g04248 [Microbotryum saponariae]|uniref:BZ3500_MvSof-1268-A1-R1_Chr2-1g04248 protein n=1 Tax=Microbotryum saponariae TaxID=289078 RepID=A0A2X0MI20_9BASI|nr:BZ3500_MvSof-1268-A1-R1_Chr2-1g04248 [Microbotryum saponariae]SCZ91235.1 BZ3501_MvSof-1269-A2-R1_Chr2-1g03904 [Microbotryum saponariae]